MREVAASSSEVVVCTKDRADDLARLLPGFYAQDRKPALLVVDSSADDHTAELVAEFAERYSAPVRYLRSMPGLVRQRIAAVRAVSPATRYVHFLDDDCILAPGYFTAMEEALDLPGVVGANALIGNLGPHRPRLLRRLFLLDSRRRGVVLASGVNLLVHEAVEAVPVQWLSGCCMSYRREVFSLISFDERIGGGWGEDVDFSFRAGRLGGLVLSPRARVTHLRSSVGRVGLAETVAGQTARRYLLVCEMQGLGMSRVAFWWSLAGDFAISASIGLLLGRRHGLERLRGLARAAGGILKSEPISRNPRLSLDAEPPGEAS